ncbi:hypothetical protein PR048_005069 [Dryococelus australis]|uniref:Uncharacterized protein n=1 Tax=Dryococelus australis TaxID=614101 RepID=A0ABQ9I766_9NEOP|nr:hypothetical protein PR048_005069 [Dryococelus australis]
MCFAILYRDTQVTDVHENGNLRTGQLVHGLVFEYSQPPQRLRIPYSPAGDVAICGIVAVLSEALHLRCSLVGGRADPGERAATSTMFTNERLRLLKVLQKDFVMSKSNPTHVLLCTDMRRVLFCPTLHHSSMFYQRQFSTYNQYVHNMGTEKSFTFVWNESVAKRGSSKVTSCILKYIELHSEPLKVGEISSLIKSSYPIDEKFLVSGHSFLPCDRDLALIERRNLQRIIQSSDLKILLMQVRHLLCNTAITQKKETFMSTPNYTSTLRRNYSYKKKKLSSYVQAPSRSIFLAAVECLKALLRDSAAAILVPLSSCVDDYTTICCWVAEQSSGTACEELLSPAAAE